MELKSINVKDSKIKVTPLCLGNISDDFSVDNMKNTLDYKDMFMILVLIMTPQLLMIY